MRKIILAVVIGLSAAPAWPQRLDPNVVMQELTRRALDGYEQRQRNRALRLELERLDLEEKLRYRRLSNHELAQQWTRYCPDGMALCSQSPPDALVDELARRGWVEPRYLPQQRSPSIDCVTLGDGAGGGITTCD